MTRVSLAPKAREDLRDALEYLSLFTDAAVTSLSDQFDDAITRLIQFSESGSPRPELGRGVRMLVLDSFRLNLYYVARPHGRRTHVTVIRLIRQERDVGASDLAPPR